jgi:hypothetical protein
VQLDKEGRERSLPVGHCLGLVCVQTRQHRLREIVARVPRELAGEEMERSQHYAVNATRVEQ